MPRAPRAALALTMPRAPRAPLAALALLLLGAAAAAAARLPVRELPPSRGQAAALLAAVRAGEPAVARGAAAVLSAGEWTLGALAARCDADRALLTTVWAEGGGDPWAGGAAAPAGGGAAPAVAAPGAPLRAEDGDAAARLWRSVERGLCANEAVTASGEGHALTLDAAPLRPARAHVVSDPLAAPRAGAYRGLPPGPFHVWTAARAAAAGSGARFHDHGCALQALASGATEWFLVPAAAWAGVLGASNAPRAPARALHRHGGGADETDDATLVDASGTPYVEAGCGVGSGCWEANTLPHILDGGGVVLYARLEVRAFISTVYVV